MRYGYLAAIAAVAFAASAASPACAQGTTRIETRPFYGATVTLEEGVRVFRPLPPEERVIINPDGKTPLSLGFNETNVYENRVIKNYNYSESRGASPSYVNGGYVGPGFFGFNNRFGRGFNGHHNMGAPRAVGH